MKTDKTILKMAADLLKKASDEFGNHSCNDYEVDNTKENREFIKSFDEDIDIEKEDPDICTVDWMAMDACAKGLERIARSLGENEQ